MAWTREACWTEARRGRNALLVGIFLVALALSACGSGGGTSGPSTAVPLPSVPVGSVVVQVPTNLPASATRFRVRALTPGTDTDIVAPVVVPVGPTGVTTATLTTPVGVVDVAEEALDDNLLVLARRRFQVRVTAGSLQTVQVALVPAQVLYVTDSANPQITVIDAATDRVVSTVGTGGFLPTAVAFAPSGLSAFAIDPSSQKLLLIDVLFGQARQVAPLDGQPQAIRISPSGTVGYLALQQVSSTADALQIFNLSDGSIQKSVLLPTGSAAVAGFPSLSALAVTPDGQQVLDAWQTNPQIAAQPVVEVRRAADLAVVGTVALPAGSDVRHARLAVNPSSTVAALTYVRADGTGALAFSTLPLQSTKELTAAQGTWVDARFVSDATLVAVRSGGGLAQGIVDIVSTQGFPAASPTVTASLAVGPDPVALIFGASLGRAYVSCADGRVWVIDVPSQRVLESVPAGVAPAGLAVFP